MVSLNPILLTGREALQLCIVSVTEETAAADAGWVSITLGLTDQPLFPGTDKGLPSFLRLPQVVHRRVGTGHVLRLCQLWLTCLGQLPSGPRPPLPHGRCASGAPEPSMEGAAKGSFPYHLVELCPPKSLLVLSMTTSPEPAGPQDTRSKHGAPNTSFLTSLVTLTTPRLVPWALCSPIVLGR